MPKTVKQLAVKIRSLKRQINRLEKQKKHAANRKGNKKSAHRRKKKR